MLVDQPLPEDVHVQHSKESAAKARAQRGTRLHADFDGAVAQLQTPQRLLQIVEVVRVLRIDARENHRKRRVVTGERLDLFSIHLRTVEESVTNLRLRDRLHIAEEVADLAGREHLRRVHLRLHNANIVYVVPAPCVIAADESHLLVVQMTAHDLDEASNASVGNIPRIEQESLELLANGRRWNLLYYLFEHLVAV